MTTPSVSLIVLNYNTRDLTLACLGRFAETATASGWQLLVVDNASTDDSAAIIAAHYPYVEVIRSPANRGYAAGNNLGLRCATGEYVLLLNSDVIVGYGELAALVAALADVPQVAAMSAGLRTADGTAQAFAFGADPSPYELLRRSAARLVGRSAAPNWEMPTAQAVDWVSGACVCIRHAAIRQVGLLDEDFFLYFEDADWCRRMRQAGWRIVYNPTIRVTHLGGTSQPQRTVANRHYYTSLIHYYGKHYGPWAAGLLRLAVRIYASIKPSPAALPPAPHR